MWAKPSPNRGAARRGPGGSPTASWPGAPGSSSGPGTSGRSSGARTAAIAVAAVLLALLLLSRSGSAKPAAAAAYGAARRPIDAATTALARKGVGSGGGASTTPAATAVPALSSLGAAPAGLPPLFLFVGVLSGRGYRHRRLAVRDSWARGTQNEPESVAKFILSEDEATPQVRGEEANGARGSGRPVSWRSAGTPRRRKKKKKKRLATRTDLARARTPVGSTGTQTACDCPGRVRVCVRVCARPHTPHTLAPPARNGWLAGRQPSETETPAPAAGNPPTPRGVWRDGWARAEGWQVL